MRTGHTAFRNVCATAVALGVSSRMVVRREAVQVENVNMMHMVVVAEAASVISRRVARRRYD